MVRSSLQLSKWLLVLLSQLAETAVDWNWCAIQFGKQELLTVLLSPFVTGWGSVTSDWEAGKEKNAPKMTCCSQLFLIHLCLWEIFALGCVLLPALSHVSSFLSSFPPLPFPIMGKWLLQQCSPAEWPNMSNYRQIGVSVLFLDTCWSGVFWFLWLLWGHHSLPQTHSNSQWQRETLWKRYRWSQSQFDFHFPFWALHSF